MEHWSHQILRDAHVCCYQQYLNILYLLKIFLFLPRNFLLADYIQKHSDANLYHFRCLPVIFLLSMMLIFSCKKWIVKWETIRASFPLSIRMVGVDNQTSQSGLISLPMDYKFKSLFKISLDVDDGASFVPTWIIRWLGFFREIWVMWWFISSTVDPGKCRAFTLRPFPHNVSSITPFITESPIITIVPLGHSPLLLFWFLSQSLLLTLLFEFIILLFLF